MIDRASATASAPKIDSRDPRPGVALEPKTANTFEQIFEKALTQWEKIDTPPRHTVTGVSAEIREMLEFQKATSALSLKTEILTRAIDGLSASLRRIQQLQG
jgi:phenylpropionate dioxygenase-like ring-hydroxylating dioxygenase large terminal subunit